MQYHMEEYGKYVEITGYRNIKFAKAEEFLKENRKKTRENIDVQFFDADLIASKEHLYFAALNALQAFRNKTNISKTPAMETMLYASAQRQISRAIQRCGIKPKTSNMAVIIIAEDPSQLKTTVNEIRAGVGGEEDDKTLEMSSFKEQRIIEAFHITDEAIESVVKNGNRAEAVINLVIEQVALLSTQL